MPLWPDIDQNSIALAEFPLEAGKSNRIVEQPLDRALAGTRCEWRVIAFCCEHMPGSRRQLDSELPVGKQVVKPLELQADDVLDLFLSKRLEDDHVIHSIEEL